MKSRLRRHVPSTVDLVLDNERRLGGLDLLGPLVFVEAKNWAIRVGSAEVAWLDWKVRLAGEFYGILVTTEGVTGRSDDETSAWKILREAKREDRHLFVMTPAEMLACATAEDFRQLLKNVFGKGFTEHGPVARAVARVGMPGVVP